MVYTLSFAIHMILLLGCFVSSLMYASAEQFNIDCPLLFFTNMTPYNVVVGQKVEATTYDKRAELSITEPFVWQVAQQQASIPLGRLNKDQFMIDIVYKFYGAYLGSDTIIPVTFSITEQADFRRQRLYNVILHCQKGWTKNSYSTELCPAITCAASLQEIFFRAAGRVGIPRLSSDRESMMDLQNVGERFVEAAKDRAYAYFFLNLPKIDADNKVSIAATFKVVKYMWDESLDSALWLAGQDQVLALRLGSSLSYYDWLGMHAHTILNQACATVESQCKDTER